MNPRLPLRRQHPVAMLRYSFRYLFLLLLPLGRGLLYIRDPEGFYRWLRGTWMDLLILLFLLLLPLVEWRWTTYAVTTDGFIIQRGVLLHRRTRIPRHSITTLTVERPLYLRLLGAVRVIIDTDAGNPYRADFHLIVGRKQAERILAQRQPAARRPLYTYRPRWYHVAVLSGLVSNSLSGVLLLATTLYQAGRILGEEVQDALLDNLQAVAGYVTIIPRTAALVALVILVGWGLGAVRNLLRYLPFRVTRTESTLCISTGVLVRRDHTCTNSAVNYVDYCQSLASRLLRLHMVFINCIGYGKGKNAKAVLMPVCSVQHSARRVSQLLPEYRKSPVRLRARRRGMYRYIVYPLWAILLLYPCSRCLQGLFPQWQELIYYLTFMAFLPCVWLLLVKLIDCLTAGISLENGFYTLRYSRLFTFHTVVVPKSKVVAYDLRQTPFQRLNSSCDVLLYTYNEKRLFHRIKSVSKDQAAALFEKKE